MEIFDLLQLESGNFSLTLCGFNKQTNNQEPQRMKRFTLMFMSCAMALSTGSVFAQSNHVPNKCSSVEVMESDFLKHPELISERAKYEKGVQEYLLHNNGQAKSGEKRIIPVVFHVLHECGPENISRAQILDQIRIMNEDYSLTNPNFSNTPGPFVPLAADCQIEFRLATKDDLGNCSDGIVRVYTPKTNEATNQNGAKAVSHWNSYKYLNVWVVKSIGTISGTGGEVLGYAQFPAGGLLSTDGVVIRHDCIGSIGTAATGGFGPRLGRTVIHEVGHWLGLRHIWGDATCGSDGVDDTPIAQEPNYGICWSDYPYHLTSCGRDTTDTTGEMFCNYMDYSDDQCMSMFTNGQKNAMDATLATYRAFLISDENLEATGVRDEDVANPIACAPVADFCDNRRLVCEGSTVTYSNSSFNTTTTIADLAWEFEGGSPATSTATSPVVTYGVAGTYNVKLTASNAQGTSQVVKNDYVTISSTAAENSTGPFWDNLDNQSNFDRWTVFNNDNTTNTWQFSAWTGFGTFGSCVKMHNYGNVPTETDDFISPSYNIATVTNPSLTFRIAGAERGGETAADDKLNVYTSVNCGQTWILRKSLSGAELITAGLYTSEFVPTNTNQWQTIALGLTSISSQTNVRFRFEFVAGLSGSNNLYLDDINIGSSLGLEEAADLIGLSTYPNPTASSTTVEFNTVKASKIQIRLIDMLGQQALLAYSGQVTAGHQNFKMDLSSVAAGLYTIQVDVDGHVYHKKIMKN